MTPDLIWIQARGYTFGLVVSVDTGKVRRAAPLVNNRKFSVMGPPWKGALAAIRQRGFVIFTVKAHCPDDAWITVSQ